MVLGRTLYHRGVPRMAGLEGSSTRSAGLVVAAQLPRRAVLLTLIAAELVVLYAMLANGSWVYDDNLILGLAAHSGLTWNWLNSLIFQHWGIAYHLVFSAIHGAMPLDYRWALAGMLLLLGGSIYLVDRIVTILFGGIWLGVIVAAYFGFSILFIRPLQWSSGGIQYLPNTFFDLLCLYGYLRYMIDPARRWVALSAAALAAGLLFYEKPVYVLLYLLLLRVLFMSPTLRPRALAHTLWRERWMWASLIAVAVAWAIVYQGAGGFDDVAQGTVSASQYAQYFRILWAQTFVPGAIGLTLPQTGLSTLQIVTVICLQIAFVLGVAISLRRKPSAWRAWSFLAGTVLVTGLVVARARIPQFGVGIGGDPRYLLDFSWLLPLTVCFAFSARTTLSVRGPVRPGSLPVPRGVSRGGAILACALLGYTAVALATTAKLRRDWPGQAARTWETQLQSSLSGWHRRDPRFVVADNAVPFIIVPPAFIPYNLLSRVAPLYDPGVQVDGPVRGALLSIDVAGVAHRRLVAAIPGGTAAVPLTRSRDVLITGAIKVLPRPRDTCITTGASGAQIDWRLREPPNPALGPYYLKLGYSSAVDTALPVYVDAGAGLPGATDRLIRIVRDSTSSILLLAAPSPRRVMFTLPPGTRICISQLVAGRLMPPR